MEVGERGREKALSFLRSYDAASGEKARNNGSQLQLVGEVSDSSVVRIAKGPAHRYNVNRSPQKAQPPDVNPRGHSTRVLGFRRRSRRWVLEVMLSAAKHLCSFPKHQKFIGASSD